MMPTHIKIVGVVSILLTITLIPVLWLVVTTYLNPSTSQGSQNRTIEDANLITVEDPNTIVIGLTVCAGGYSHLGRGQKETANILKVIDEPLTMIKSVLISASRYKASHIEFRIFVDSWTVKNALQPAVARLESIMKPITKVTFVYHNVFKSIPKGYERDFIDGPKQCAFVRSFFPQSLPENIHEILYLDTNTLVTGNISELWWNFKIDVTATIDRHPARLAGLVKNSAGEGYKKILKTQFQNFTFMRPAGLSTGVMFMNLAAMRKFKWSEKVLKVFLEHRDIISGDDELINMIFYSEQNLVNIFPCTYNFQHWYCEKNEIDCLGDDSTIYVLHGSGGVFTEKCPLRSVYLSFRSAPLKLIQQVDTQVEILKRLSNILAKKGGCFAVLAQHLGIGKDIHPGTVTVDHETNSDTQTDNHKSDDVVDALGP